MATLGLQKQNKINKIYTIMCIYMYMYLSLVPRPLPRFQCCTLKTWEWPGDEAKVHIHVHVPVFCVLELMNDLRELGVGPRGIDDLGN